MEEEGEVTAEAQCMEVIWDIDHLVLEVHCYGPVQVSLNHLFTDNIFYIKNFISQKMPTLYAVGIS